MRLPLPHVLLVLAGIVQSGCGAAHPSANSPSGTDGETGAEAISPEEGVHDTSSSSDGSTQTEVGGRIREGTELHGKRSIRLSFAFNLTQKGKSAGVQSGDWALDEERSLTVKAADGSRITDLEVAYGLWEAKPLLGLTTTLPTQGKTYRVSRKDANLIVTMGSSGETSAEERKAVEADYAFVGDSSPLRKALDAAPEGEGVEIDLGPGVAREILGEIPGADIDGAEIKGKLVSRRSQGRGRANLTVESKFAIQSDDMRFDLTISGPITVDSTTGWVEKANLSGTLKATGQVNHKKRGKLDAEGQGKIELSRTATIR